MKRFLDIVISAAALLVLLPLLFILAVGVLIFLGRPILFCQVRPGRFGRPFCLVKFRTMRVPLGSQTNTAAENDAERMTTFGRFLRATSLDELPELWNVLKGDMSLVGPRPLLMEYLPLYTHSQRRRLEVRPGMTGWAQVNGRNALSWERRFALDTWYVDHQSVWLDLRIMLLTVLTVIRREGISGEGCETMSKFRG